MPSKTSANFIISIRRVTLTKVTDTITRAEVFISFDGTPDFFGSMIIDKIPESIEEVCKRFLEQGWEVTTT